MNKRDKDWEILRAITSAGPSHPVYNTRRQQLSEMKPGEKLLIVRKHGGLGDILITTMLFESLLEQFPINVTYACPVLYHQLFEGFDHERFSLMDYEEVYGARYEFATKRIFAGPESPYHKNGINKEVLETFDLIEDISAPCRNWEELMVWTGAIDGARTLRWRNRLDRWASWIGFDALNPRSAVRIREEEMLAAREKWFPAGDPRPFLIWSPISMSEDRTYPWFMDVTNELEDRGLSVFYLHWANLGPDTIHGVSLREMGAVVAAADYVLSVDTATFHWGGILKKPTLGLFNVLMGTSHAEHYPTARTLQLCSTPCVAAKYYPRNKADICPKWYAGPTPKLTSRCFHPDSVKAIVDGIMAMVEENSLPSLAMPDHAVPCPAKPSIIQQRGCW